MKKAIIFVSILLVISISMFLWLVYNNKDIFVRKTEAQSQQIENTNQESKKEITKEEKYLALGKGKIQELTLDEKIGQLLLVRYPNDSNSVQIAKDNCLGGYVLFEKDFKNKTTQQVQNMIENVQAGAKIPLIMAVDEEGGTVVRISSNRNLAQTKFKSPRQLYLEGGFEAIKEDTSRCINQ